VLLKDAFSNCVQWNFSTTDFILHNLKIPNTIHGMFLKCFGRDQFSQRVDSGLYSFSQLLSNVFE